MNNRIYHIIYAIMILIVVGIIGCAIIQYDGTSQIDYCFDAQVDYSSGWMLHDEIEIDTSKLRDLKDISTYEAFSVFNTIPEDITEGQYLCFRSKNIFFSVYFDGELVYEPYMQETKVYTKSYGTQWHYVPIKQQDAGKQIEIKIIKVYESARSSVDNLYIGQPAKVALDMIKDKMVAFITCIITLFVGFVLVIVDIPINLRKEKNHELLYLGLFSLAVAIWCLAETHLLQLFMGDSRTMQLVSCCPLALISIPMILYLDAAFGFKKRAYVVTMIGFSAVSFLVMIILHLTGVADVHETLTLVHVILIMSAVTLLYVVIKNNFIINKFTFKNIYSVLRLIGLSGLSVATGIDIYRFYCKTGNDTAMFVRIGLLIFIICLGSSSLEKTINAVKIGVQTEFVSQLAYRDGLTQIGNRTSFEERLDSLEKDKEDIGQIGIVMFDVNDLKYVNDNLGHLKGDSLLIKSANLIKRSFENVEGECFRIGGDEFIVLLCGDNVMERYDTGINAFLNNMKEYNAQPVKEFRVSIAYGFAYYDNEQKNSELMNVYKQADMLMYENKKILKQNQIPPQEYYQI